MKLLPIPPLRAALDVGDAAILLGDGRRVELDPGALAIVGALDGELVFDELLEKLRRRGQVVSRSEAGDLIRALSQLDLLEPINPAPLPLKLLERSRFRCQSCGACCRSLDLGPLEEIDLARLEQVAAAELVADGAGYRGDVDEEGGVFLRKLDGACVFLDHETQLCRIHAAFGVETKPLACRSFPVRYVVLPGAIRVSMSPQCERRFDSWKTGDAFCAWTDVVRRLQRHGFVKSSPFPDWAFYVPEKAVVELLPEVMLPLTEYLDVEKAVLAELLSGELGPDRVLAMAAHRLFHTIFPGGLDGVSDPGAAARKSLVAFCGSLLSWSPPEMDEDFALALSSLQQSVGNVSMPQMDLFADRELRSLAAELLSNELWTWEMIRPVGFLLPGLVLLVFVVILSRWLSWQLAERAGRATVSPRIYNLAFKRVYSVFRRLEMREFGALVAFAACSEPLPA